MSQRPATFETIVEQTFPEQSGLLLDAFNRLDLGMDNRTLAEDDPFGGIIQVLAQTACQLRQSLAPVMLCELFDPHDAKKDTPLSPEARVVFSALLQDGMLDMVRAQKELAAYQSLKRGSPILMLAPEVNDRRYLGYNVAGRLLDRPEIHLVKQPFSGGKADYRREPEVVYSLVGGHKVSGDWRHLNPTAYGSFQKPAVLVGEALQKWLLEWARDSFVIKHNPDHNKVARTLNELAFLSPLGQIIDETKGVDEIKQRALSCAPDITVMYAKNIPKRLNEAKEHHLTYALMRMLKAVHVVDPATQQLVQNAIVPMLPRPVYLHIVEQTIFGYDPSKTDEYDVPNLVARLKAAKDYECRMSSE